jgi:L-seryl-tRNA(Ser) seleniumtransferase
LATWVAAVRLEGVSAARLERGLRGGDPPVIARVLKEEILLDVRTVQEDEIPPLAEGVVRACEWSLENPSRKTR